MDDPSSTLFPALIQCFSVIGLGYISGVSKLISQDEVKGLNTFIGTFSFPAVIFLSLAELDFSSVNWTFLLAVAVGKALVFIAVIVIALVVTRDGNMDEAGLFAIFCTQSNDFALGYPIVNALYGKTNPEYVEFLYLVAPVNLLFLNPIAIIMMETAKQKRSASSEEMKLTKILAKVVKGVFLNPIIIMTACGIAANFMFARQMPFAVKSVLDLLGSAYSATSLFSLGLTVMGRSGVSYSVVNGLILPGLLIFTKLLVVPITMRELVIWISPGNTSNETTSLSNFAFLYGTFPVAPGVFVYSSQYEILMQMISSTLVASTVFAAPLMYVSAKMIAMMSDLSGIQNYVDDLNTFLFHISYVALIFLGWAYTVMALRKFWRKFLRAIVLSLALSQGVACIGVLLWSGLGVSDDQVLSPWKIYLEFVVYSFGVLSSRIWTAILATYLVFRGRFNRSASFRKYFLFASMTGWGIPAVLTASLLMVVRRETVDMTEDPNFQYGQTQAIVSTVVLVTSFLVTAFCLIIQQRQGSEHQSYRSISPDIARKQTGVDDRLTLKSEVKSYETFNNNANVEALVGNRHPSTSTDVTSISLSCENDEAEILRYILLLLFLSCSMFVGIAFCVWTLVMEKVTGIYVALMFLDGALNFGQGFFTCILFGFDKTSILAKLQKLKDAVHRSDMVLIKIAVWCKTV